MNKQIIFLCMVLTGFIATAVHAEIYKHVDADGRITYSNVKIKNAKKLDLEPADTNFGNTPKPANKNSDGAKSSTPSDFPKVDSNTQNQRDAKRKDILKSELASEKQALERAKQAYTEGESNPEVYQVKNANGSTSTFRNVPKYQEKMKALQAEVDAHQRNIDLLTKELNQIN
jgi:1,2-phenylacetyl-CoA epoxidase PaaB subunit